MAEDAVAHALLRSRGPFRAWLIVSGYPICRIDHRSGAERGHHLILN